MYVNPLAPMGSQQGVRWIEIGQARSLPQWFEAETVIDDEIMRHGLDRDAIGSLRIGGHVFGTHEDGTPTVACFDDFRFDAAAGPASRVAP